jgi:hypothetical protein
MAELGSIVWPSSSEPLWRLGWGLIDCSTHQEGIVIESAYYRGHQVFYKASLPIIRVQYLPEICGPFKDPLCYNNARTTSRCPSNRVCVYSYVSNGFRCLGVESYHTGNPGLGNYRITHRWVFVDDGRVLARLYSAGLQCNANHNHHSYWRFDFDIDGAGNDLVLEYNTYTGDVGWGNGWDPKTVEISRTKWNQSRRSWAVLDKSSGRGYHILPGPNDGTADVFSNRDIWLHRYQFDEDRHGNQGNPRYDLLSDYINGENIDGQDVVAWYCGHLHHDASDRGHDWHGCGPNLVPFGSWD